MFQQLCSAPFSVITGSSRACHVIVYPFPSDFQHVFHFVFPFVLRTLACQSVQGLSWCIISLCYHLILGKEKWFSHSDSGFLVSVYDTILHSFVFTISILSSCLNEIVDDHVPHPCICYPWRPSAVF